MFWFDLLFPPAMIMFPALMTLIVRRPKGVEIDEARLRRLSLWLWGGTVAALALFAALWFGAGREFARHAWVLCFPLFGVQMQLLVKKNPDWGPRHGAEVSRTASLVSRRRESPIGRGWWWLSVGLSIGCLLCVLARLAAPISSTEWTGWIMGISFAGLGATCPWMTHWVLRFVLVEPEPMDSAGSPALAEAYAANRRFRIWGFYWMFAIAMAAMFGLFGVAVAWLPFQSNTGLVLGGAGGLMGTLLGLTGAAFGIMGSLRTVKINELRRRLEAKTARA